MNKSYDYIIIGAGISGCSVAYELSKQIKTKNILIIDKLSDVALGASGAAGAFLSPLLGKPNNFKDLVTKALKYSIKLYQNEFPELIDNCGTTRIPKNKDDEKKFQDYIPFMDFKFKKENDGYFFDIGSVIKSYDLCKDMINQNNIKTKFNYEVHNLKYDNKYWILNDNLKTKNIILTTGVDTNLLNEFYINIRSVWGRRIDITTATQFNHNYHKACSVSKSIKIGKNRYLVSIGATHHREKRDIEDLNNNINELLKKANDIKNILDANVIKHYQGARACSVDYFPMVGKIIDSKKTLNEFPYLKNGTKVESKRFSRYENFYILNGVGGRGFVLGPYLAKQLVDNIINKKPIDETITIDRLFQRDVRKIK
jgi:glycine/D-amino acid oxidase-like deaminating enzyme